MSITFDNEIRETVLEEKFTTSSSTYWMNLKKANNGALYIVVSQSKKTNGRYEQSKMRIFLNEMLEFDRILNKLVTRAVSEDKKPALCENVAV